MRAVTDSRDSDTVRERVKVQRGWKSMKTSLAEGQRIEYNFVKLHEVFERQTPAQVAVADIEAKDKWMELLNSALGE